MAEKRMISKSISISERVNRLTDTFHILLFTWMIPHSDDFGRLFGSPLKVKALVVPMLDKTIKEVEEALCCLHREGLINWYEVGSDKYIQIENFDHHQSGLHKRTKSKFPEPPGNSGNFPEIPSEENRTEENRTEEKGREQKGSEKSFPSADDPPVYKQDDPFVFYQNNFDFSMSPFIIDDMKKLCDEFGDELVVEAMKRTLIRNKKTWSFVTSILKDWRKKGISTLEQAKEEQEAFEQQKSAKGGQPFAGARQNAGGYPGKGGASPFDGFTVPTKKREIDPTQSDNLL